MKNAIDTLIDDGITIKGSDLQLAIIERAAQGQNSVQIAVGLQVTETFVVRYLATKEVRDYLKQLRLVYAEQTQMRMLSVMSDVVEDRISMLDEEGERMAKLSKRDTLDVMKVAAEIAGGLVKADVEVTRDDVYLDILDRVTK